MTAEIEWTESAFRASTTGQAWSYTEYDRGWETCRDAAELRVIFEEEMALESVPDWAVEIVERMLASPLPACGHYSFPRPILQVCEAIAQEQCPDLVVGCYTADPERKSLMSRYVFCLDAWLEQAPVETAQAELGLRADRDRDWDRIVEAIYATLGERTEERILLVRRLAHRLRWWLKTLIWDDDRRDRFGPDLYLGDARGSAEWGNYGNPGFDDPYFAELEAPEVRALSEAIRSRVTDGGALLEQIESTWLCAPKAFRYLERLITAIGAWALLLHRTPPVPCSSATRPIRTSPRAEPGTPASSHPWTPG